MSSFYWLPWRPRMCLCKEKLFYILWRGVYAKFQSSITIWSINNIYMVLGANPLHYTGPSSNFLAMDLVKYKFYILKIEGFAEIKLGKLVWFQPWKPSICQFLALKIDHFHRNLFMLKICIFHFTKQLLTLNDLNWTESTIKLIKPNWTQPNIT